MKLEVESKLATSLMALISSLEAGTGLGNTMHEFDTNLLSQVELCWHWNCLLTKHFPDVLSWHWYYLLDSDSQTMSQ